MLGEVLVRLLTEAGHTCRHVENGMDAWETLFDDLKAFDLVITDHEMPGLTGLQLVEVITASRRFSLAWIMLSCARY